METIEQLRAKLTFFGLKSVFGSTTHHNIKYRSRWFVHFSRSSLDPYTQVKLTHLSDLDLSSYDTEEEAIRGWIKAWQNDQQRAAGTQNES